MAKPTIVTRSGKGSALTWTEGDANLTNLQNATIAIKAGSAGVSVTADLNSEIVLVAGTNITLTGDNTGKTITIDATGGGATTLDGLTDVVITAAATGDILRYNGTDWVDTAESSITVGTASVGSTVTLTADNTTNATNYPLFANAATGNLSPRTDTGFTYNPSTGSLTATTFVGALSGNATTASTASSASVATNVTLVPDNTGNATNYPLFSSAASGNIGPRTDTGFTYNPSTGVLTATQFVGGLDGIVGSITPAAGTFTTLTANGATNGITLQTASTALSSTAWAASGINLRVNARTYTDTSSTGTVATNTINIIGQPTIASTNTTTITDAINLTVGPPVGGTNTTINNAWAIHSIGNIRANAFTSTVATGTAPFTVASTTQVANLNAATAGTATNATNVATTATTTNATFFIPFVASSSSGNQALNIQSNITYNPSTLTFSPANLQSNTHIINGFNSVFSVNGTGLRAQSGTFTDTATGAGTVAADYFHVINAPTRASTNAITVTNLANLYVAAPLTGTNTTASNRWAILSNGNVKADAFFSSYVESTASLKGMAGGAFSSATGGGTGGGGLSIVAATYTNTGTAAAGTQAASYANALLTPTFASTNAITVIDAANLFVAAPAAGTNTTITNRYAVLTDGTIKAKEYQETVFALGNSGAATLTPDAGNGNIQTITATGNFTLSAFANPTSGETITFIITQDGVGSKTLTSTMRFAGGSKTLSTAANAIDILTVSYIGTTYYASLAKGFV